MLKVVLCLMIVMIFSLCFLNSKNEKNRKFWKFSLISLSILIILELTLFNFRFYESLNYKEIVISDYTIGEGIIQCNHGALSVVEDTKDNYIEINNINEHLDNIYLNFETSSKHAKAVYVTIGYTDAANKRYAYVGETSFPADNDDNGEIRHLHLSGKSKRIKLYIRADKEDDTFTIKSISFNKRVPFNFTLTRPFLALALLLVIYIFRPKSEIYKIKLLDNKSKKYIWTAIILQLVFMGVVSLFNIYFVKEDFLTKQRYQYQMLAEAFMKGQTYLDEEPDEVLLNLKNPYDKKDRTRAFSLVYDDDPELHYMWDAAYFNGKYYVYFGVAPVILYYLPVYALTGHHIKTITCVSITMLFTVLGVFLLLYDICKKWFKKVNLGSFLAFTLLFINGCGLLSIMGRPDHYSLPILMGIMFSIYGLWAWLKASENNLKMRYLFFGSLCMASVAACRPQLLLTSFFAIPIFWSHIFKDRELFSKKSILKSIMFILPFIVIAILLMLYNKVRFGSIVDFGANYNLTTNDMTKRGFVLGRIPTGIFYYLFNPINVVLQFPFVFRDYVVTSYIGTTIYESMPAGFFICNFLTLIIFKLKSFKKDFEDKKLYNISLMAIIFTIIIIIADTQMAGILPRYICDFGFLLYLATGILLFNLLNKEKNTKFIRNLVFVAFIFGLVYNFLNIFNDVNISQNYLFFFIRKLFAFWL